MTTSVSSSVFEKYALDTSSSSASSASSTAQSQTDFLTLMTEQMKNQDPLNPTDNGEFLSQMAQFSQVSSIEQLVASFNEFSAGMLSSQTLDASNLIGKSVMVTGDTLDLNEGSTVSASLDMDSPATNVVVSIYDASGSVVDQIAMGSVDSGVHDFTWNGRNSAGEEMPTGTYYVTAEGMSTSGNTTAISTLTQNEVTSVSILNNSVLLNTSNGSEIKLADVQHIM